MRVEAADEIGHWVTVHADQRHIVLATFKFVLRMPLSHLAYLVDSPALLQGRISLLPLLCATDEARIRKRRNLQPDGSALSMILEVLNTA